MKKRIHIMIKKERKKVYVTVFLFILYSIWVHAKRPNTKWFA